LLHIDNAASLYAINKGTCKNKMAMSFIRELYMISLDNNFYITARYINTHDNVLADALSRIGDPEFSIRAAELLLDWDSFILHPSYDLCQNMSVDTACLMLQALWPIRNDIWMRMWQATEVQCMQRLQNLLINHNCEPI
jgi:hypothetical protein